MYGFHISLLELDEQKNWWKCALILLFTLYIKNNTKENKQVNDCSKKNYANEKMKNCKIQSNTY